LRGGTRGAFRAPSLSLPRQAGEGTQDCDGIRKANSRYGEKSTVPSDRASIVPSPARRGRDREGAGRCDSPQTGATTTPPHSPLAFPAEFLHA